MHQQLWGYKVEEKLYLGLREQKRLNTTALGYANVTIMGKQSMFQLLSSPLKSPLYITAIGNKILSGSQLLRCKT
jgi:hypothetical protein